jgi:iron complex outermembrane receptor protein
VNTTPKRRSLQAVLRLAPLALAANQVVAQQAAPANANQDGSPRAADEVQEVVVTAQKRLQTASKIPLALSVVSGEELKEAGAVSASALTNLAPGVQIGLNNGAMNINIRGVTSNDATEKGDPSASFNLDGVNLARPQAAGLTLFDLDRVEVLRGPQGTLYGRNATAGAVNVITMKPQKAFGAALTLDLGNYKGRQVEGMLNVPVAEALALRAAVSAIDHLGYVETTDGAGGPYKRGRDDQKSVSARLHALIKPGAHTSILLTADTSSNKGAGFASVDVDAYLADRSLRRTAVATEGRRDNSDGGFAAELKTATALGELSYQFGRRSLTLDNVGTSGSQPLVATSDAKFKQQSHELRLASAGDGPLQWVAGLYHFDEKGRSLLDVNLGFASLIFDQDPVRSRSAAAFGQATWSLAQDTRLTAGLRSTRDRKSRQGSNIAFGPPTPNDAEVSYSQSNWKLGVEHDLASGLLAYASASTGYKAGGFNDGTVASNPNLFYDPEHLTAYEAGLKGRLLGGRLSLSLAGFYYDYKDLQLTSLPAGATTQVTSNAAKAKVYGLEFEGRYALTAADKLTFALSGLSAKYRNYSPDAGIDWSGRSLDKSPKATVSLGYSRQWALADGSAIEAQVSSRWSAKYVVSDFENATQYDQPAVTRTDLRIGWLSADDRFAVQAYVRNLENKSSITGFSFGTFMLSEPRLYGVSATVKF